MGCMSSKQAKGGDAPPSRSTTTKKEAAEIEAPSESFRVIKTTAPSVPATAPSTTSPTSKGDDEWWNDTTAKAPASMPTTTTTYQPSYSTTTTSSSKSTGYRQTRGPIYRSYGPSYAYTGLYESPTPPHIANASTLAVVSDGSDCASST